MRATRVTRLLSPRRRCAFAALALAGTTVGCGASAGTPPAAGPTEPDSSPPAAATALALVATEAGLAAVPVGTAEPLWVVPGAVAAPDGSAVFTTRPAPGDDGGHEVLRIDPGTGAEESVGHVPGPTGLHVAAVEPGGGRVALAAPGEASTTILDFDPAKGAVRRTTTFEGRVEPEAFSTDRSLLFAARIYEDRYHVHVLDLDAGTQYPTLGPDKSKPPEDMYGSVVQAALSADGTQLATLYRDATTPDHTAFVHLLSLESGSTVCVDLHAPFGTEEPGTDAIAWQDDGTVAVGHRADDPSLSMTATFDPAAIWGGQPQEHYHADAVPDRSPPGVPEGLAATPGFLRFIALVD